MDVLIPLIYVKKVLGMKRNSVANELRLTRISMDILLARRSE